MLGASVAVAAVVAGGSVATVGASVVVLLGATGVCVALGGALAVLDIVIGALAGVSVGARAHAHAPQSAAHDAHVSAPLHYAQSVQFFAA